ncbi:hypothetical protein, partial [Priestia megaterium]|uniref:hypothetical protein n=1 Tax=Priestia megaterium TaxID=1404 RepID=UPI001C991810
QKKVHREEVLDVNVSCLLFHELFEGMDSVDLVEYDKVDGEGVVCSSVILIGKGFVVSGGNFG